MDKALYFPYISIPKSTWVIKTLLYWDRLSSIVPLDHIRQPRLLEPYMRGLIETDLVDQISPRRYIENEDQFTENFIRLIDARKRHSVGVKPMIWRAESLSEIHVEKLGNLAEELIERRLAQRTDHWAWLKVERETARLFMTYLACVLGRLSNSQPITDAADGFAEIVVTPDLRIGDFRRQSLRALILDELLPAPDDVDDLDKFIRFRDKHHDQMIRFRRHVETFVIELEGIEETVRQDRLKLFLSEAHDQAEEIRSLLKGQKWQIINLPSLCVLAVTALSATSAIRTGDMFSLAATGMSLLGAVSSAIAGARVTTGSSLRQPLVYAVLANQKFQANYQTLGPSLAVLEGNQLVSAFRKYSPRSRYLG
jgi:hypothetical protein